MKKFILLPGLLFFFFVCAGQNYMMFYEDQEALFAFPNGEITGIRFDQVNSLNPTVLVPNPNITYNMHGCSAPYGNTLVGNEIIVRENGDHLMFNLHGDSILIKTQAHIGTTWIAHKTGSIQVDARVELVYMETFLDISDTVKQIGFICYDSENKPIQCPVNNLKLKISRSYGMIQALAFKFFPDLEVMSYHTADMREIGIVGLNRNEEQHGYQNLSWFEVHDYNIGDERHTEHENSCWWLDEQDVFHGFIKISKTKLKYIDRLDNDTSIVYKIAREGKRYSQDNEGASTSYFHDTITEVINENSVFDKQPNEAYIENGSAYIMTMNISEPDIKIIPSSYGIIWNWGDENDTCWYDCCIDGCNFHATYLRGLGGPYGGCGNFDCAGGEARKLKYYKKGDKTWGTPLDLTSVNEEAWDSSVNVYPNPASEYIVIESSSEAIDIISLFDMAGKAVLREECHSSLHVLNLNTLEPGIYMLSVWSKLGNSQHKVVVN